MSPASDAQAAKAYAAPENNAIRGKEILCLVNPFGGNKDADFQFENVALVMLNKAGAGAVSKTLTTHAGHLEELGAELAQKVLVDEKVPDVVLIFGGDGSTCEFVDGMVKSATKRSMELASPEAQKVLAKVAYSVVPTGSCNGIAASYGARTTYEAIVKAIETDKGGATPFDAMEV
jgi:diacylglycerol kinase family enzyme